MVNREAATLGFAVCVFLLATMAACGDPLVSSGYQGEATLRLPLTLRSTSRQTIATQPLQLAVAWGSGFQTLQEDLVPAQSELRLAALPTTAKASWYGPWQPPRRDGPQCPPAVLEALLTQAPDYRYVDPQGDGSEQDAVWPLQNELEAIADLLNYRLAGLLPGLQERWSSDFALVSTLVSVPTDLREVLALGECYGLSESLRERGLEVVQGRRDCLQIGRVVALQDEIEADGPAWTRDGDVVATSSDHVVAWVDDPAALQEPTNDCYFKVQNAEALRAGINLLRVDCQTSDLGQLTAVLASEAAVSLDGDRDEPNMGRLCANFLLPGYREHRLPKDDPPLGVESLLADYLAAAFRHARSLAADVRLTGLYMVGINDAGSVALGDFRGESRSVSVAFWSPSSNRSFYVAFNDIYHWIQRADSASWAAAFAPPFIPESAVAALPSSATVTSWLRDAGCGAQGLERDELSIVPSDAGVTLRYSDEVSGKHWLARLTPGGSWMVDPAQTRCP